MRSSFFRSLIFSTLALALMVSEAAAQPRLKPVFTDRYNTATADSFYFLQDMAADPQGNVYTIGWGQATGNTLPEALLIKYDRLGNRLWTKTYHPTTAESATAERIVLGPSGNVYIKVAFDLGTTRHVGVAKFSPDGALLWEKSWAGGGFFPPDGDSLALDSQENVIIGDCEFGTENENLLLWKVTSSGQDVWSKVIDGGLNDEFVALATDAQGNIAIGGRFANEQNVNQIFVARFRADGTKVWDKPLFFGHRDRLGDLTMDAAGNVLVTASIGITPLDTEIGTLKLAATSGMILWDYRLRGSAVFPGGAGNDIRIAPDGDVVVTGLSQNLNQFGDIVTLKLGSEIGQLRWVHEHHVDAEAGQEIAFDRFGNIYVMGTASLGGGIKKIQVLVYSPGGTPLWRNNADDSDDLEGDCLTVDPQGNVYVGGSIRTLSGKQEAFVQRYSPYSAIDQSISGDDKVRLLTRRADGLAAQLRLLSPTSGAIERINTLTAEPGYTAQAIATGTDNKTYLLWQKTDGAVQLWRYNANLSAIEKRLTLSPYWGNRPIDVAVGLDNKLRLSYRGSGASNRHHLTLRRIKADFSGIEREAVSSPPTATQQVALTVGRDNIARVLWDTTTARTIGKNSITSQSHPDWGMDRSWAFGPVSSLIPLDIAMGFDSKARLLLRDTTTGGARLWRWNPATSTTEVNLPVSAPLAGAIPLHLSASLTTRNQWVLWVYPDGRCLLRNIDPSTGAITAQFQYSVY